MAPIPIANAVQPNAPPQPSSSILSHHSADNTPQWTPSTVLSTLPPNSRPTPHTPSPVPFFHLLERLKTTKREGWRRFGIDHGESISDHMYRMSIMTMLCPRALASRLDLARCTKMALVHDMAELLVGDITPVDGVPKREKSRREATTMDYLCGDLLGAVDGGGAGEDLRAAWQEYEDARTLESKFVHDVDKMELILQMLEYERAHGGKVDLGEFTWVATRIELPEMKEWCKQVMGERAVLWEELQREPNGVVADREGALAHRGAVNTQRKQQQDEYYGDSQAGDGVGGP